MNEAKPYTSRGTPEVRVRRSAGCSETWYPGGKNGKVRILCSNFVRVSVSFWAGFCFLVSAEDRRARRTAQAGRPCHCEEWIRTDNQNVAGNAMFTWNFVSVGLSFTSLAWYNRPGWMGVSNFLFFFILKFLSLRQVLFVFDLWTRPPPLPPPPPSCPSGYGPRAHVPFSLGPASFSLSTTGPILKQWDGESDTQSYIRQSRRSSTLKDVRGTETGLVSCSVYTDVHN